MPPRSMSIGSSNITRCRGSSLSERQSAPVGDVPSRRGSTPRPTNAGATATSNTPLLSAEMCRARRNTAYVHASTATGSLLALRLIRVSSLSSAWKLIRRSTRSTAASAASIARATASCSGPLAVICSSVPIAGRARRSSAQDNLVEGKEPLDAIGDVVAGQCSAADVHDVGADLQRIGERLADELIAPLQLADLIAVRLAVFDHLELAHAAVGIDAEGVGN